MLTIDTTVTVTENGTVMLRVPASVAPGRHRIVLMIKDQAPAQRPPAMEVGDAIADQRAEADAYAAVYGKG